MSFLQWSDGFSRGYYLAGIETNIDAVAPRGWEKWIMPARKYFVCEVELNSYMEVFNQVIKYELPSRNLKLSGATCDFTDPNSGKNYIYFPIGLIK